MDRPEKEKKKEEGTGTALGDESRSRKETDVGWRVCLAHHDYMKKKTRRVRIILKIPQTKKKMMHNVVITAASYIDWKNIGRWLIILLHRRFLI